MPTAKKTAASASAPASEVGYVVVRPEAERGGASAVLHPVTGQHVCPRAGEIFLANDPLVLAFPWMFTPVVETKPATIEGSG